ncbi:Regulatory protein GAL4 [Colletotrichum tanaceti]|uniref:Regulatory protein GAL4 n=1 Tax=Colletotrichum tanaceti TaxID=1306861 RepID=A0A4U6XN96_9PEZI|nr:Regulatory protein GAL4 [Colletotrichum tanaceti]TKW57205.1 Regulatory protein GAL4 [Colletotrichum tanaceti]
MPPDSVRRCSNPATVRACVNCQRRKSRCMRGGAPSDPCSYCAKSGKPCSFESPPDRTPLTRKNLDAAELRCAQLRDLLRSLDPGLEIESALKDADRRQRPEKEHVRSASHTPDESDESDEVTPPYSYEWHEGSLSPECKSSAHENDGMAMLSTHDSGYLGSSSGSQILGEIDSVIHVSDAAKQRQQQQQQVQQQHQQQHPTSHRSKRLRRSSSSLAGQRLPPTECLHLQSTYIAGRLIDAYFLLYNTSYPVLHEKTFRERVDAGRRQRPGHSPPWRVVYQMVLAIGHWLSSPESEHLQSVHYSAARSSLSLQMLESGTVETVQAFLLMSNYLQKRDRTNTGYNFGGLAYRMALGLGLHREPPGSEDTLGHERRRQLFWTIYCFESGFNITTGRPPAMSDDFIDTRVPRNIDDKELPLKAPVPPSVDYPTTYSAIIAHAELAKIADAVYHEFLLAKTAGTKIEYRVAETLERDLNRWQQALPAYFVAPAADCPSWFRAPRAVVLWKEQNLRILLWRGSQLQHSYLPTKVDADKKCLDAAMRSVHDIAAFCLASEGAGLLHQGIIWYATYFLFQATLVLEANHLTCAAQSAQSAQSEQDRAAWQHSVSKSRACLKALAPRSRPARRCLEMLDRIHGQFQYLPPLDSDLDRQTYSHSHQSSTAPRPLPESTVITTCTISPANDFIAPTRNSVNPPSENDFAFYGGSQPVFSDNSADPSLRMLLNEASLDFMQNMPLDLLLGEWAA